jgi:hypothetical protein
MNKNEYINNELTKPYKCDNVLTMLEYIKRGERVVFTKFGDGEFLNMTTFNGCNSDNDNYTYEFGMSLRLAFIKLCILSINNNIFIGKWHHENVNRFLLELLYDNTNAKNGLISVPFVNYHFILADTEYHKNNNLYEFVKTIQEVNKYKIIVGNKYNRRLEIIFKGDVYIEIPESNWFSNGYYNIVKSKINEYIKQYNDAYIIMAGGMASKILISELISENMNISMIDIGSCFDILAGKRDTRKWYTAPDSQNIAYPYQLKYFKSLLPADFT